MMGERVGSLAPWAYCAHEQRKPSGKETQIQAFRVVCREMESVEGHEWVIYRVCYIDLFLFLSRQNRLKTLRI